MNETVEQSAVAQWLAPLSALVFIVQLYIYNKIRNFYLY